MSKHVRDIFKTGQKGFTLIELMAVMAILAVLVAVVAPSVTGQKDASVNAQTLQDATQVRSAAAKYFANIDKSEVRTPHTITTQTVITQAATDTLAILSSTKQHVSNKWPEKYITMCAASSNICTATPPTETLPDSSSSAIGAEYDDVFETKPTGIKVDKVTLLNKDGSSLTLGSGDTFVTRYTAVNFTKLTDAKLLEKAPAGTGDRSEGIPNFLWLFEKTSSSAAAEAADDNRNVAVFKLVKVVKMESADVGDGGVLELTYKRIF